jgi:hypothetical protein
LNSNVGNAAHYQSPTLAYDIDLSALHANPDLFSQRRSTTEIDALLSGKAVSRLCSTSAKRFNGMSRVVPWMRLPASV